MTQSEAEIDSVARMFARELEGRPRSKIEAVFRFTMRGFDYDTAINALAHGLRVGMFREENGLLVAADDGAPSAQRARADGGAATPAPPARQR